jgi:hypothetical protein
MREVGPEKLRNESLAACREGFKAGTAQKVPEERWPDSVRAFQPLGFWAEPDGAYILLDSDASGERGVYLPRILTDKDPLCGPALTHVKLAAGVYSYERKRETLSATCKTLSQMRQSFAGGFRRIIGGI